MTTRSACRLVLTASLFAGWYPAATGQDMKQIADPLFHTEVDHPAFVKHHPRLLFDEAHHNRHTIAGRFKPFAELLTHDGFHVIPNRQPFRRATLKDCRVLVIANALANDDFTPDPAFTDAECDVIRDWVSQGGALLLIADHAPFGRAAKKLSQRFGVDMRGGYTMDSQHCYQLARWQLVFARENGLLQDHPITRGRNRSEYIRRVMTFGGQSLRGPPGSTTLLKLGDTAVDQPAFQSKEKTSAAGRAQAVALEYGKGRVVVLGEAAMVSAQVLWIRGVGTQSPMGMNFPGVDNRQFTLNMLHWLAGRLP